MEEFDRESFALQMRAGWMLGSKIMEDMRAKARKRQANRRIRTCQCTPDMAKVCRAAFIDGFKKGWREHAYQSKRKARHHECVESGQDGQ